MNQIIDRTIQIAHDYLGAFGFEDDKIDSTVAKGIAELELYRDKLRELINKEFDFDILDRVLHTIKGILFQLGNNDDGRSIDQLRDEVNAENYKIKIEDLIDKL